MLRVTAALPPTQHGDGEALERFACFRLVLVCEARGARATAGEHERVGKTARREWAGGLSTKIKEAGPEEPRKEHKSSAKGGFLSHLRVRLKAAIYDCRSNI